MVAADVVLQTTCSGPLRETSIGTNVPEQEVSKVPEQEPSKVAEQEPSKKGAAATHCSHSIAAFLSPTTVSALIPAMRRASALLAAVAAVGEAQVVAVG